jgi:phosphotransferase system enzyme I (PtsP)
VQDETRARINRTNDPYLRERLHDFDDLARRLMRHLAKSDGARPKRCRKMPSLSRAAWDRRSCSIMAATG